MSSITDDEITARAYDGFGIASFTLGAIAMLAFGMLSICATAFNRSEGANAIIGACMVLIWMIDFFGVVLGIASIACHRASKTFPVLGISINLGLMSLSAALIAIGLHKR